MSNWVKTVLSEAYQHKDELQKQELEARKLYEETLQNYRDQLKTIRDWLDLILRDLNTGSDGQIKVLYTNHVVSPQKYTICFNEVEICTITFTFESPTPNNLDYVIRLTLQGPKDYQNCKASAHLPNGGKPGQVYDEATLKNWLERYLHQAVTDLNSFIPDKTPQF